MTSPLASTRVLVTGVNGFIGLHTALHLLQLGYAVRGTVRSAAHEEHVRENLSKHTQINQLEFALADLLRDDRWSEAIHGCHFVMHVASPYPAVNPIDERELIAAAREGTLRVLRAAQAEDVRRLVMLSTIGAVFDGHEGENRTFDEADWSDLGNTRLTYHKSKTLAERAAWDYVHSTENGANMEMVAVNPSNVFGPVLDGHHHTATEWFRTVMRAEVPGVSRTQIDLVDVRDLVDVMVKAMTTPEAADKRFICNAASIPLLEFADILHERFASRGYRVQNRIIPDLMIRVIALFVPKVRTVAGGLNWEYAFSTEQVRSVLGWQPRPYEQTIIDMAESLIQHGLV